MEAVGTLEQALSGSYEIETVLGRGGSATVYLARDVKHARRVALKVLRPELSASLGSGRFVREIQIGARLQHPHILPLYESGEAGGFVYYAMPYVEGENLRQRIGREGPLPLDQVVRIIHDVAEALGYAHEQGVVHRDVKPENILLTNGHALVADFGIARALSLAGGERLTSSGVAVGTPAYMSPEQGTGKVDVDARSDVYSLGCVLHEMLAGEPPFTGPTPQAVIARHVSERPPSLRVVRPNVDRAVERVVEVALAKVPADRFASVMEFSDTLTLAASGVYPLALRAPRRWRIGLLAGAAALVLAAVIGFRAISGAGPGLDPGQYVVAPFVGAAAAVHGIDPDVLTYEFTAALRQVPDVAVIDGPRLSDVLLRAGSGPGDFDGWRTAARRVAAGSLVPLSLIARGDSVDLVAELYETRSGRRTRRASVAVAGGADLAVAARRLAELLFSLPRGAIDYRGTDSPEARRAFIAGKRAMEHWDLERAQAAFLEAAELDPQFAPASFWLAQIRSWRNEPASAWRGHARNAVAAKDRLTDDRERLRAAALLAMAEGRHPQACAEYEGLLAADSLDFQAWFGLGECHGRDEIVVPDTASPSGWRFRGSYHTAAQAYTRALELVPSFMFAFREEAYERLTWLLYTEPNYFRYGHPEGQDTVRLLATAGRAGDTLQFTPYPASLVFAAAPDVSPATSAAAIDENRRQLLGLVRTWSAAFPDSAKPHVVLAHALEVNRHLATTNGEESAFAAAQVALRSANGADDSLAAATVAARVLLKLERFGEAAQLARAVASRLTVDDPILARRLAGLHALVGQVGEAVRYVRVSAPYAARTGRLTTLPVAVHETREALLAHAAFGVPTDSIAILAGRLDTLIAIHTNDEASFGFGCQIRWGPLTLAFPVTRRTTDDADCWRTDAIREAQWALVAGDSSRARRVLDQLAAARTPQPGQVATLSMYLEAMARLELADTTGASARLDHVLTAIPVLRADLLPEIQQVAGLVHVMALRARLAAATGDSSSASRWARNVVVLWDEADNALQPEVDEMRRILGLPRRQPD